MNWAPYVGQNIIFKREYNTKHDRRVKVVWPLVEKFSIYITKVEEIKYPVTGEYVDDSKEILKELVGPDAVESLDDNEDEKLGDTEDENC